jgi:hypothetical protein
MRRDKTFVSSVKPHDVDSVRDAAQIYARGGEYGAAPTVLLFGIFELLAKGRVDES